MPAFDYELVGKIGSMALIRKEDRDIDYNIFARLGSELRPGMIWVSSGAAEIGRLDYLRRHGHELTGDAQEVKADYAAQGQTILMGEYRRYIPHSYSVRQLLVEHTHFNDEEKRGHIRSFLMRCASQGAIPIVNYNDPVSVDEIRKMELAKYRAETDHVVECVDNDETASVICELVKARYLVIFTSADGIYRDGDIIYARPENGLEKYASNITEVDGLRLAPLVKYYELPREAIDNGRQTVIFG